MCGVAWRGVRREREGSTHGGAVWARGDPLSRGTRGKDEGQGVQCRRLETGGCILLKLIISSINILMRPPPQRNFVGFARQVRPSFGTPPGPTPAPVRTYYCPENTDNLLKQSCIHGHERQAMPLLTTNRFRSLKIGDYSRHPPAPKLQRLNTPPSRPLVKTFE